MRATRAPILASLLPFLCAAPSPAGVLEGMEMRPGTALSTSSKSRVLTALQRGLADLEEMRIALDAACEPGGAAVCLEFADWRREKSPRLPGPREFASGLEHYLDIRDRIRRHAPALEALRQEGRLEWTDDQLWGTDSVRSLLHRDTTPYTGRSYRLLSPHSPRLPDTDTTLTGALSFLYAPVDRFGEEGISSLHTGVVRLDLWISLAESAAITVSLPYVAKADEQDSGLNRLTGPGMAAIGVKWWASHALGMPNDERTMFDVGFDAALLLPTARQGSGAQPTGADAAIAHVDFLGSFHPRRNPDLDVHLRFSRWQRLDGEEQGNGIEVVTGALYNFRFPSRSSYRFAAWADVAWTFLDEYQHELYPRLGRSESFDHTHELRLGLGIVDWTPQRRGRNDQERFTFALEGQFPLSRHGYNSTWAGIATAGVAF